MQRLLAFAHYLHEDERLTPGAIQQSLTGLRHEFRSNLLDIAAFEDHRLRAELRAFERTTAHPTRRRGSSLPFNLEMVLSFSMYADQHPSAENRMCAVGALLGFFCLMRGSEYCVAPKSDHTLRAADVQFEVVPASGSNSRGGARTTPLMVPAQQLHGVPFDRVRAVRIVSHSAKNRKKGQRPLPTWFTVASQESNQQVCMVYIMYRWAMAASFSGGTDYFVSASPTTPGNQRRHLTTDRMESVCKAVARRFGLNPARCGTHSLRNGGATTLHAAGASMATIVQAGGWRGSSVAATYPQKTSRGNDLQLHLLQSREAMSLRDIRLTCDLPGPGADG